MTDSFASRITKLSKTRVVFLNGKTAIIPAGSPCSDNLAFAKRVHRAALVRTRDRKVTFADPAWVSGVNRTIRAEKGLLVYLHGRASALLLPSAHPKFKLLAGLFNTASIGKRILAVAQIPGTMFITDAIPTKTQRLSGERAANLRRPPLPKLRPTTLPRLVDAMASFRAAECVPTAKGLTSGTHCVPFNFPADGCNARAAYMCDEFTRRDIASAKVFCFAARNADLHVETPNDPCHKVSWEYHVATAVKVGETEFVIDPALSNKPLTIPEWKALMAAGGGAEVILTRSDVFGLDQPKRRATWRVHFDTRRARAAAELEDARLSLTISARYFGPPPYAKGHRHSGCS